MSHNNTPYYTYPQTGYTYAPQEYNTAYAYGYQAVPNEYLVHSDGQTYYYPPQAPGTFESWVDFRNSGYLKGFVVGAAAALVLTNPTIQKALVGGVVKIWSAVQGGVEEVKEQIHDIRAEMSQKDS
ncbi:hypothetical protein LZ24_00722 [Desulfobotulus alkaliphilus]|uniref:Uncharacterized protein n=1 Tax=Desulfobotulus alkaliphilus TaxID=622671 RepID=A0A562S2R5_9BACT|nr:YtxH domain-containing protein [Desulfobotulus alkaliphilus]TWI75669.1 hypothetical protein LZ24_00722 [Desulfobotulus alkaliphilus]